MWASICLNKITLALGDNLSTSCSPRKKTVNLSRVTGESLSRFSLTDFLKFSKLYSEPHMQAWLGKLIVDLLSIAQNMPQVLLSAAPIKAADN